MAKDSDNFRLTKLEATLFEIAESAIATNSIEEYSSHLHSIIQKSTYAENFFVALYEKNKTIINFVYVCDEFVSDKETLKKLSADALRRTITGYMLRSGKTQHLSWPEVVNLQEKNIVDLVGKESHDWLGVPLKYNDEILGGIVIQSYREDVNFNSKDESILQFVARHLALVLKSKESEKKLLDENSQLEQRVKDRMNELKATNTILAEEIKERKKSQDIQSALFQITELVSTTENLEDLFVTIHNVIKQVMTAENEYIAILDEDTNLIDFVYFVDNKNKKPEGRYFNVENKVDGFTEKILLSGEPYLYQHEDGYSGLEDEIHCVSWLGVPLKNKQKVFGVLAVQSYKNNVVYTIEDQMVLMTIGQQVASTILRKKDSDSLIQAHETLERRVKERTIELEKTIEKRKIIEKRLEHESLHDALTGLPNRLHLSNMLNELLNNKDSSHEVSIALLFLDLDRFKIINDSLGHHVGDLFLIEIAKRLQKCIRHEDMVARLGGDEFCILMPNIDSKNAAFKLCTRILNELKKKVQVSSHNLITSASIGVRLANTNEVSSEVIMSDADAAMYQAKHQGKNCFCFFDSNIKKIVTDRMKMERDLREAVERKELYLVYQPIVNIRTKRVEGLEALVRWQHPENGFVSPEEFIPIAEETGIIVELGELIVEMACETLSSFKKVNSLKSLTMNVNVSSVQVLARTLDEVIRCSLSKWDVSPNVLNVEITESILIEDYKAAMSFVREMKTMNINVYLDDFGTGYSSLSYLHKFPFDAIKLDRSFINALDGSKQNAAIVESIGLLAKNLDIKIVAEGLETENQLDVVKNMNYDLIQGYFFSKPLPENEVQDFVENLTVH